MFTTTKEIRVETSTLCDYHCLVCPRESFKRPKTVMATSLFKEIIQKATSELPHIQHLTISGFGEFAIDKEWRIKIKLAKECFEKIHIVTNASRLTMADLDFLLENVADIRISVYGADETVYKAVHNQPEHIHYTQIKEKILYLLEHRSKRQRILLNYIELPANRSQTKEWIGYWSEKTDLIEVWKPHNWINGKSYRQLCSHRVTTCGRPFNGPIQVQVDGTVNMCCFDYNGELLIGDLKNQSFTEIFNGDKIDALQKAHNSGNADTIPQCHICDQRDCADCKGTHLLYNSGFNIKERIMLTSTEYENLKPGGASA